MYILALLFSLLYAAITMQNVGRMIHSPHSFPIVALVYLPVSIALTWLIARRLRRRTGAARWIALAIVGLGFSAVGTSLWFVTAEVEETLHDRQEAGVKVERTEESIFYSRSGNPIGLKLVFTARVPSDDWYQFREPSMGISEETWRILGKTMSGSWPGHALGLTTYREEVAAALEKPTWFEEGIDYTLTYYVVPTYVVDASTEALPCIWVPENFPADKWESLLNSELESTYTFSPIIGEYDPEWETRDKYSQKMFFDGIRKENVPMCPSAGRSPDRLSAFPGIF